MAAPVVDPKWSGTFTCAGPCKRTRLVAAEFSAKQLARRQADPSFAPTCKQCVEARAAAERDAAAARQKPEGAGGRPPPPPEVTCGSCGARKPSAEFSRSQAYKGDGKAKCASCVAAGVAADAQATDAAKAAKLAEARAAAAEAQRSGTTAEKVAAFARESALESELVTGVKPATGRGGRGRGRGRSNPNSVLGRGRGRG